MSPPTTSNFFQSPSAAKKARKKKKKADASLSCQMSTGAKTGQGPSQQSVSHSQQLQQNSAAQVIASSSNAIVAHSLVNQAIFQSSSVSNATVHGRQRTLSPLPAPTAATTTLAFNAISATEALLNDTTAGVMPQLNGTSVGVQQNVTIE
jgi:hypothetical protein